MTYIKKPEKKKGLSPNWAAAGCVTMLVVPIVAWFIATWLVGIDPVGALRNVEGIEGIESVGSYEGEGYEPFLELSFVRRFVSVLGRGKMAIAVTAIVSAFAFLTFTVFYGMFTAPMRADPIEEHAKQMAMEKMQQDRAKKRRRKK